MPVLLPATAPGLTLKVRGHISESQDLNLRARKTKSKYSEFSPQQRHKVGLVKTEEEQLRCYFLLFLFATCWFQEFAPGSLWGLEGRPHLDLEVKYCAALAARCAGSAAALLPTASIPPLQGPRKY